MSENIGEVSFTTPSIGGVPAATFAELNTKLPGMFPGATIVTSGDTIKLKTTNAAYPAEIDISKNTDGGFTVKQKTPADIDAFNKIANEMLKDKKDMVLLVSNCSDGANGLKELLDLASKSQAYKFDPEVIRKIEAQNKDTIKPEQLDMLKSREFKPEPPTNHHSHKIGEI